jgi:MFS family permease
VGSLSDHVGRRPVLLTAVALQAATLIVFVTAGGVPELLVARIVQGLATGAAVGLSEPASST